MNIVEFEHVRRQCIYYMLVTSWGGKGRGYDDYVCKDLMFVLIFGPFGRGIAFNGI